LSKLKSEEAKVKAFQQVIEGGRMGRGREEEGGGGRRKEGGGRREEGGGRTREEGGRG
jgi:hypothetical protein